MNNKDLIEKIKMKYVETFWEKLYLWHEMWWRLQEISNLTIVSNKIDNIMDDIESFWCWTELLSKRLYGIIKNTLERHLSTTTESQEADGEWTELAWKQYCTDEARDRPKRKENFKKAVLSNLPKTNDKKIDELIEKRRTYEPLDWNDKSEHHIQFARASIDLVKDEFIEDLQSLKSPTTTDEMNDRDNNLADIFNTTKNKSDLFIKIMDYLVSKWFIKEWVREPTPTDE